MQSIGPITLYDYETKEEVLTIAPSYPGSIPERRNSIEWQIGLEREIQSRLNFHRMLVLVDGDHVGSVHAGNAGFIPSAVHIWEDPDMELISIVHNPRRTTAYGVVVCTWTFTVGSRSCNHFATVEQQEFMISGGRPDGGTIPTGPRLRRATLFHRGAKLRQRPTWTTYTQAEDGTPELYRNLPNAKKPHHEQIYQ